MASSVNVCLLWPEATAAGKRDKGFAKRLKLLQPPRAQLPTVAVRALLLLSVVICWHTYSNRSNSSQRLFLQRIRTDSSTSWLPNPWVGTPLPLDPLACTPQLLVVGPQKCGTTALWYYLNGTQPRLSQTATFYGSNSSKQRSFWKEIQPRFHPGIIGSQMGKEPKFFLHCPEYVANKTNMNDYLAGFHGVNISIDDPLKGKCSYPVDLGLTTSNRPAMVRFEASAGYLTNHNAALNIKKYIPQARFVLLLREPVTRTLSSINMAIQQSKKLANMSSGSDEYRQAWERIVTADLRREIRVINLCLKALRHYPEDFRQLNECMTMRHLVLPSLYHVYNSMYAVHLERWYNHFTPEQTLVWSSKAFKKQPRQHLDQLVDWLGLDRNVTNSTGQFATIHRRSYPTNQLPRSFLHELSDFFAPHNNRAIQLLSRLGYNKVASQLSMAWPLELQATTQKLSASADAGNLSTDN